MSIQRLIQQWKASTNQMLLEELFLDGKLEFNEVCQECGVKMSEKKLSEEEYDEYPGRDEGYCPDTGNWFCSEECRELYCTGCPCHCDDCPICNPDEKSEEEDDAKIHRCMDCDYFLYDGEFQRGKGRIMFCEGEGICDGEYRCGKCDGRATSQGYFPITSDEEDSDEEYGL